MAVPLFDALLLFVDGIHLVTGIKNNMKNTLVELKDKILLRKRSVIETVNDELNPNRSLGFMPD